MIRIIEYLLQGKNQNEELNEDGIFTSNDYVAIIDGVTSKSNKRYDGITSGRYAKDILIASLAKMDPEYDAVTALKYLNSNIPIVEDTKEDRIQASIILYSNTYKQIWSYGDCKCMIDGIEKKNDNEIEKNIINQRIAFLEKELKNGKSVAELLENDTGRLYIQQLIKEHWKYANVDHKYGYPVLDGILFNEKLLRIFDVADAEEIILASDGYPFLLPTLEESENIIQELKIKDPLCMKIFKSGKGIYPGNNNFDDRSYIRFMIK